ncbi:MAG: hypothetical protein WC992_06740 [Acholeplasmataceae bacterium]
MLLPKRIQAVMEKANRDFVNEYAKIIFKMKEVMEERGAVRDRNTPIYIRRSPAENLGIAHGKVYRMESLLTELNYEEPQPEILRKLIEEAVDIANYVIFIAALAQLCLDEED